MSRLSKSASIFAGAVAVMLAAPVSEVRAEDLAKDSKANELGLVGEKKARFSARVVDILCELSGDCPDKCGDGGRQLGLVRKGDSKLIIVTKNSQFQFNGAVPDLLPYCGKDVDVDGLMIGDDPGVKSQVYMVQLIRESGDGEFTKTTRWTDVWKERNPEIAEGKGAWYLRDPRVQKQIEKDGYFGLGAEVDAAWRKENQ